MVLKVFNTLSRKKEIFTPLSKNEVKFYSCGQTVYDDLHIGNARTYSNWDIVTNYLRWKGYNVVHVQNFTDVGHLTDDADSGDDKIEKRAKERKINPYELVDSQIRKYYLDTDELNIKRANIMPRATCVIPEMIEMIKVLLEKGYAYIVGENVYFDTSKFKNYGQLAKLKLDEKSIKNRVCVDKNKKNCFDFALWLSAKKKDGKLHLMNWGSPWGKGYPGWHIECSVMAKKFLGNIIDIHAGGIDHIPVHHTNEIAQSEAANGVKFANYWLHSEFITIDGEKMSKSKGNFYTARELIDKYGAMNVRYVLSNSHYRKSIDFKEELFENAKNNLEKLNNVLIDLSQKNSFGKNDFNKEIKELINEFTIAMDDDFNTSQAMKAIQEFVKKINKELDNLSKKGAIESIKIINELLGVLGLKLTTKTSDGDFDKIMKTMIKLRNELRKDKNYKMSDLIRDELGKLNIELKDDKEGTKWFVKK